MINSFQEKLSYYQRSCADHLSNEINQKLFNLGDVMLREYKNEIRSILSDIQIDGYDFTLISSFNQFDIGNIDDIIRDNESDKTGTVTRWKENLNKCFKHKLFGVFKIPKIWEPDYVSYEEEVIVGKYVNVNNVVIDIIGKFSRIMKDNIDDMFFQARNQISSYKRIFNRNLSELNREIDSILFQLQDNTENFEKINERLKENTKMYNWTSNMESEIKSLLNY